MNQSAVLTFSVLQQGNSKCWSTASNIFFFIFQRTGKNNFFIRLRTEKNGKFSLLPIHRTKILFGVVLAIT